MNGEKLAAFESPTSFAVGCRNDDALVIHLLDRIFYRYGKHSRFGAFSPAP